MAEIIKDPVSIRDYRRFLIGHVVGFGYTVEPIYEGQDRFLKHVQAHPSMPRVGRICGIRRIALGKYHNGSPGRVNYAGEEDYDPPSLYHTRYVSVWEVRIGLANKPRLVLDADADFWGGDFDPLPVLWTNPYPWCKESREALREEMEDWPRGPGGRWLKKEGKK